ncbi:hypothetical protein [Cohnella abietis]|uniref:Uncharacterized protein n=1 Tax=Cohnella abietis TaxID=2507935 RepID=A0A3T1DAD7_9BACL|nr:hypothetical protein [Cohnella abietis]BBI34938.1 hypothetical protein KCTCHS21_43370 [Cohnella abietis]
MMRRRLIILGITLVVLIGILFFVAKQNRSKLVPEATHTNEVKLFEVPFSQKGLDWNHDGEQDRLSIIMTEGVLVADSNPGPFEGEYYVGEFVAELTDLNGKVLQRLDLAPTFGEELRFRKGSFELVIDDYNGDNNPDFTIGQYASSNGNVYNIYTIRPDGIFMIGKDIFSTSSDYSIPLSKASPKSFLTRYYDNTGGSLIEATYQWDGDTFKKIAENRVEEIDPKELSLTITPNEYGFQLNFSNGYYVNERERVASGNTLAVPFTHIEDTGQNQALLRRVIGIIDLQDQKIVSTNVITDTNLSNSYDVSSALEVFGLLDEDKIVYSNVLNKAGSQTFNIEALNLRTSEIETLVVGAPTITNEIDSFALNWYSSLSKKLVFNKYHDGDIEVINLKTLSLEKFRNKYKHSWPTFKTAPSPDGSMFWYENKKLELIDLQENIIAQVPYPKGMINYPIWEWSKDSQYSALYYTSDNNPKHIMSSEEMIIIAPQGIRLFNKEGKEVASLKSDAKKDEYVDIAGWLPEYNSVLLRYFHLDRENGQKQDFAIADSAFKLYDIKQRRFFQLKTVQEPTDNTSPVLVESAIGSINGFLLDLNKRQIWEAPNSAYVIRSDQGVIYTISNDDVNRQSQISRIDVTNSKWDEKKLPFAIFSPKYVGQHWIMYEGYKFIDLAKLFQE